MYVSWGKSFNECDVLVKSDLIFSVKYEQKTLNKTYINAQY